MGTHQNKTQITRDEPTVSVFASNFAPTGRYTQEQKDNMDEVHKGDFLWPEEQKLMHHLIMEQNQAFAWDDSERGRFRTDFLPPVMMPTIEHKPWVYRNIPIPAGILYMMKSVKLYRRK
jgi:hypothetical protein